MISQTGGETDENSDALLGGDWLSSHLLLNELENAVDLFDGVVGDDNREFLTPEAVDVAMIGKGGVDSVTKNGREMV